MSIKFNDFIPRPGIVNKQGQLPDPSELVCVEVPKVFDQCLIKRCLVYEEGPDTETTDRELRSNPLESPKRYIRSKDFTVDLRSVNKVPVKGKPGFKRITLDYMISFLSDYIDCDGITKCELFEINRTDVIGSFYCPDSVSKNSASLSPVNKSLDSDSNIIKLEMVAEALDGQLKQDNDGNDVLDITLGYYIVVKCELIVQLLIPTYDYCPVPRELCAEDPEDDPCDVFNNAPVPKFYPDQNLEPLFPDSENNSCTYEDDF